MLWNQNMRLAKANRGGNPKKVLFCINSDVTISMDKGERELKKSQISAVIPMESASDRWESSVMPNIKASNIG